MRDLSLFQDAFSLSLHGNPGAIATWVGVEPAEVPGLAVYRNTVARGAVDALLATYGTVARIVGEEWFRAAAAVYAAEHKPSSPSLLHYGESFPEWLSAFGPAADTPYLPAIATLDRLWWEAYFAADASAVDPVVLSQLSEGDLSERTLVLHPSVRLAAFEHNLGSLWLAQQGESGVSEFEVAAAPEWVLIMRSGLEVRVTRIAQSEHSFLSTFEAQRSLLDAANQVHAIDATVSLSVLFGIFLDKGVFTGLGPVRREAVT